MAGPNASRSGQPGGTKLRDLRAGAIGEVTPDFARDIERDPRLLAEVARAISDTNFPATLDDDILDAVGISTEAADLLTAPSKPTRRNDAAFRELVLVAYEYRCAICGYDGLLIREKVGIEAAHVRWWAADGPDELSNALAPCSLHHKLFDRGAIGLTTNHTAAVSTHFIGRSAAAEGSVLSLVDRPLLMPQAGQSKPHSDQIAWHRREVFRAPARQAVI